MLFRLWKEGRLTHDQMTPNERRAVHRLVIEEAIALARRVKETPDE